MTRKVLLVLPSLKYGGAGRQLSLLATSLPRDSFEVAVCVLGPDGPMGQVLRDVGVKVVHLGWTRLVDVRPFWRLRHLIEDFKPNLLHVWNWPALRAVRLAVLGKRHAPLVASQVALPREHGQVGALDRWLLGTADRVIVTGPAEAERCHRLGVPLEKTLAIPPGVAACADAPKSREEVLRALGLELPFESRFLLAVGPLETHKGYRDAVWAFDILRYLYNDLHLLLVGTGAEEERLREFSRSIGAAGQVHLVGDRADVPALMSLAEVVWVPSRTGGGVNVALEAMASGKPVVASRLPELAEIVADGLTGFLVPPGDKVTLARQTRLLLEDAARRRLLAEAGRQRVATHFASADLTRRFAQLYDSLA